MIIFAPIRINPTYVMRGQANSVIATNVNIKRYIDERLPEEYEKCLVGLNAITREAWNAAQNTEDKREKIQALSLAKECYSMKLDLLTNATVVDDAIKFVSLILQMEFSETSAPLNPSISDFGTLYSWRSPSLVITTVSPSIIASTFPAS